MKTVSKRGLVFCMPEGETDLFEAIVESGISYQVRHHLAGEDIEVEDWVFESAFMWMNRGGYGGMSLADFLAGMV